MKKEYTIDYKGFIADWRCRWVEVPKDIRKGKIWKPYDISVPDYWSETAIYKIKTAKYLFFMTVEDGDERYRYHLDKELLSLLDKYTHEEYTN